MSRPSSSLTRLARVGFASLTRAAQLLDEVSARCPTDTLLPLFSRAGDPDQALTRLNDLLHASEADVLPLLDDPDTAQRLVTVLGASNGLADRFLRHPDERLALAAPTHTLPRQRLFVVP